MNSAGTTVFRLGCLLSAFVAAATPASAGMLVGNHDTLTQSDADQLEAWIGQGPVTLTNIFDYKANGTPFNLAPPFHANADGMGPTITVIRVGDTYDYNEGILTRDTNQIIGGYDPQSWNSSGTYNITVDPADRTAFLFNLTTGEKQGQKPPSPDPFVGFAGEQQTYNISTEGPVFGGGKDLDVFNAQSTTQAFGISYDGYAQAFSYGPSYFTSPSPPGNILSGNDVLTYFSIQDLEVFRVTPSAVATPEPGSGVLLCLGGLAFGFFGRRRAETAGPSGA